MNPRLSPVRPLLAAIAFAVVLPSFTGCGEKQRREEWARLRSRYHSPPLTLPDFEQRIDNYSRFAAQHAGTQEAKEAEFEILHLQRLEIVARAQELSAVEKEVRSLLAAGQVKAAQDCLGHGSFRPRESPDYDPLRKEIEEGRRVRDQQVQDEVDKATKEQQRKDTPGK
jgi:hypothetical protein